MNRSKAELQALEAAGRLARLVRLNVPYGGKRAMEILTVLGRHGPQTMGELESAIGQENRRGAAATHALRSLMGGARRIGEPPRPGRPVLVARGLDPGARWHRYRLTEQGEELIREALRPVNNTVSK